MENDSLDLLEKRIDELLSAFNRITEENRSLRIQTQNFERALEEKERIIQEIKSKLEQRSRVESEIEHYKVNQDTIRNKVESLIDKLKEFET